MASLYRRFIIFLKYFQPEGRALLHSSFLCLRHSGFRSFLYTVTKLVHTFQNHISITSFRVAGRFLSFFFFLNFCVDSFVTFVTSRATRFISDYWLFAIFLFVISFKQSRLWSFHKPIYRVRSSIIKKYCRKSFLALYCLFFYNLDVDRSLLIRYT